MEYGNFLKTLSLLQPNMWLLVITFALSTVVSGCATEYVLNSERFWAADTSKVILVAFCLTTPVWAINSVMAWILLRAGDVKHKIQTAMAGGGLFTSIIYLITAISLAKAWYSFFLWILFFELVFVFGVIWATNRKKTSIKKVRISLMHILLLVLNVMSCLFIIQIVFGLLPLISCGLEQGRIELINGFVVDMSVGIITSTFFYYLLVYLPEKSRRRQVRLLTQDKINFLCGLMQVVVGYFCDKYQISCSRGDLLDADFRNLPPTRNFGEEPMMFWFKRETVSDYSGSTEIGFLNYYLMNIREHASMLYASNAMILDDLELLSVITRIKDSKLISSVGLLNVNRKLGFLIPALSQQISEFLDHYKSLAIYTDIYDITLKGEKPDNIIPIVYQ